MIVVEDVLKALFIQIPERTNNGVAVRKPFYHFGDKKEANKFISAKGSDCYPLIYQISNEETHLKEYVTTTLELVICTLNENQDQFNTERWELSYKNVLLPLLNDIIKCLEESMIIFSEWEYSITKVPNYSDTEAKEDNGFIDIVDAIVLSVEVTIRPKGCLNKNIKFNN